MVIGLIAGIALAPPIYRRAKIVRAHWIGRQVAGLIEQQQYAEALKKAQTAWLLAPKDPEVLRLMARLYSGINSEYAFAFWDSLLADRNCTDEDLRQYARFALISRRIPEAKVGLNRLLEHSGKQTENLFLAGEFYFATGDTARGLEFFHKAVEGDPGNREVKLALCRALLQAGGPGPVREATLLLGQLADGRDPAALSAIAMLSRILPSGSPEFTRLTGLLDQYPASGEDKGLLLLELKIRANPAGTADLLEQFRKNYDARAPGQRVQAGRWLNQQHYYAEATRLINPGEALQRQDLFLVWADAMASQNKWAELDQALSKNSAPLDPFLAVMFRARAARELGHPELKNLLWSRALNEAGRRSDALWYMAGYAEKLHEYDLAKEAYARLIRMPDAGDAAFLAMIHFLERAGDTRGLRDLMLELSQKPARQDAAVNDLAYLNLLLGEKIGESCRQGEALLARNPLMMAYRVTCALGYLRQYEPGTARRVYEAARIRDLTALQPGWQAVYAAILGADGDVPKARALARLIPQQALKPEEKALILPYL